MSSKPIILVGIGHRALLGTELLAREMNRLNAVVLEEQGPAAQPMNLNEIIHNLNPPEIFDYRKELLAKPDQREPFYKSLPKYQRRRKF